MKRSLPAWPYDINHVLDVEMVSLLMCSVGWERLASLRPYVMSHRSSWVYDINHVLDVEMVSLTASCSLRLHHCRWYKHASSYVCIHATHTLKHKRLSPNHNTNHTQVLLQTLDFRLALISPFQPLAALGKDAAVPQETARR